MNDTNYVSTTSIVISMYNASPGTLEVVDGLFFPGLVNQAGSDKQLILIDDASPLRKETKELVSKYRPELQGFGDVQFVENEWNLGFGGSYNKGMKQADGEVVVIANDDIYLTKGSIDSLTQTASVQGIGAAGPVTNGSYGFQNTWLFKRIEDYAPEELERIEGFSTFLKKVMAGKRFVNSTISGFCLAIPKQVLEEGGYFDEKNFPFGYWEDTDLTRRIRKTGLDTVVDAQTFVEHGGPIGPSRSTMQKPLKVVYRLVANGLNYGRKWNDRAGMWIEFGERVLQFATDKNTITDEIRKAAKEQGVEVPK